MTSIPRNHQTILDLALTLKNTNFDMKPTERTLLVLGNKNSGKTTLIHRFFDKSEKPKPTLALEYTFARRSGKSLAKDICHVWELGGDAVFKNLLSVIIGKTEGRCLSIVLVLDLSKLNTIWNTLDNLLEEVFSQLKSLPKIENFNQIDIQNNDDKQYMTPLQVPLIIVGSKYDVYQNYEPAKKRIVCQSLRYVAHTYGASLLFYSTNEAILVKRAKEVLSHYGFGTSYSKNYVQDSNKPLFIPAGTDSFDSIDQLDGNIHLRSMQKYKHLFTTHFKQAPLDAERHSGSVVEDPLNNPNYVDPVVDEALKKKQEVCTQLYTLNTGVVLLL
ncbi:cytoplasmic dynein 2 light intermediate chain 1 [Adelges cooleyi]|uniref:cytoplasmic dynein 2 light intermediate chain 1 n=1 Tax=Adelges cooleyi TaxID=133065 RepID=UPI00218080AC|nr:cytoplasmic dynein 2 light intermediate chain 1 [Adelges cooleyi]